MVHRWILLSALSSALLATNASTGFGLGGNKRVSSSPGRRGLLKSSTSSSSIIGYNAGANIRQPYGWRTAALSQSRDSNHQASSDTDIETAGKDEARSSQRSTVLITSVAALTTAVGAAKLGFLPGPLVSAVDGTMAFDAYTDAMIFQDLGSAALTASLGYAFVKIVTTASDRGWLESRDSRKIIHTLSAPLFMLFWPIFSEAEGARIFAAIVPSLNTLRLYLASTGAGETSLLRAVSRDGDRSEALGGPFIYVCILASVILCFWRTSPVGVMAMSALAAGDGVADLVGRRLGKGNEWPGQKKSVAGSIAFWIGSTVVGLGLLSWMQYWGCLSLDGFTLMQVCLRVSVISLVAGVLELVPIADDNYTVPISAGLLAAILLR